MPPDPQPGVAYRTRVAIYSGGPKNRLSIFLHGFYILRGILTNRYHQKNAQGHPQLFAGGFSFFRPGSFSSWVSVFGTSPNPSNSPKSMNPRLYSFDFGSNMSSQDSWRVAAHPQELTWLSFSSNGTKTFRADQLLFGTDQLLLAIDQ